MKKAKSDKVVISVDGQDMSEAQATAHVTEFALRSSYGAIVSELERERDEARAKLVAAEAELENYAKRQLSAAPAVEATQVNSLADLPSLRAELEALHQSAEFFRQQMEAERARNADLRAQLAAAESALEIAGNALKLLLESEWETMPVSTLNEIVRVIDATFDSAGEE